MSQLLTVALAQYPSGRDCMEIVAATKAAAAEIVVFPEMYSNGYACFDPNDPAAEARWCAEAETLEGDFVGRFREAAKAHRVHVVSTFLGRAEPKPFNAALLIDPGGHPLLHHRKVHICDFDSPELACGRGSEFAACDIETVACRRSEPSCRRSCGDAAASSEPSRDLLSDDWVGTTTILSDRSRLTPSSLSSRASGFVQSARKPLSAILQSSG